MEPLNIADALASASLIQRAVNEVLKPPSDTVASRTDPVIYAALVRNTRGYLEKVAHQINGCYAEGWYDGCAVMVRRFIETLIIECFEAHQIQQKIKDANGDYFFLRDLVDSACSETKWTLGRNVRKALPRLKDIGDKSAHSRRFNAHREDVDKVIDDLREVTQELIELANLKRKSESKS
jgi:hypothetical protein